MSRIRFDHECPVCGQNCEILEGSHQCPSCRSLIGPPPVILYGDWLKEHHPLEYEQLPKRESLAHLEER